MKTNNFVFMAIGKANKSNDGQAVKRYVGIASTKIVALNPTKDEMEKIYGRTIDNDPVYTGEKEVDGKKVQNIRIEFITHTDDQASGENGLTSKLVFFLENRYNTNKDKSKVQIVDKYGRFAWAKAEEVKNKAIPQYANGPANIDKDYRPAYVGEEALTNAMRVYLGVQNVMEYKNGTWVMRTENLDDYCLRLDDVKKLFTGDVQELREWIKLMPENVFKALYGVRTLQDGKLFQTIYSNRIMYNGTSDYSKLTQELSERTFNDTVYEVCPLKEYVVAATNLEGTHKSGGSEDEMPWGDAQPADF